MLIQLNKAEPSILICAATTPTYFPPPAFSPQQVILRPQGEVPYMPVGQFSAPVGTYDLPEILATYGLPPSYDLIWVYYYPDYCQPRGLDAVQGTKVIFGGDTHREFHLTRLMAYLQQEHFDALLLDYTRQHLPWFAMLEMPHLAWLPGLNATPVYRKFSTFRRPDIVCAGNLVSHKRRHYLFQQMETQRLPVWHHMGGADVTADMYASSALSFNCSAHGDLNLRVMETLAAGGTLLTDQLHPEAGLDSLFTPNKELITYHGVDDLREKAAYYLEHPQEALAIAYQGQQKYLATHTPEKMRGYFWDWLATGEPEERWRVPPLAPWQRDCPPEELKHRLEVYAYLNYVAMLHEPFYVLVHPAIPARYILDWQTIPRLKVFVWQPDAELEENLKTYATPTWYQMLTSLQQLQQTWHLCLSPKGRKDDWVGLLSPDAVALERMIEVSYLVS